MESHRIKNIIIVILLIVNGFLLVLVGRQKSQSLRYERAALSGSIQVLAQNGVAMEPEAVVRSTGQQAASAERSLPTEYRMAAALLGESTRTTDRGGGLYTYTSELGQVTFRSGGEMSAELADQDVWYTRDAQRHAGSLLEDMGVACEPVRCDVAEGSGEVIFRQMLNDAPLFSCQLTFNYEAGRLVEMHGTILAVEQTEADSAAVLSLSTVLMNFIDSVLESGDVCSAIGEVEPGYLISQSFTGTVRLRPVWYVSTNAADYYVDGISGEVTRAGG